MRTQGVLQSKFGVALVALVATLPFLGKAFHVDDPLYIAVARQILEKPWDPFGAEILWEREPEKLFDADFNPPLWSYLLAGVLAYTGEPDVRVVPAGTTPAGTPRFRARTSRGPEIASHLLESLFVAAAIAAMFVLGRRWVRAPLAATALVALSPAMLPGQNAMLEGPVLAFWLWAVWCHLRAIERNDGRWSWATGALAALAIMTKYTSGVVIVVLALYSIRRRHWRSLLFLVVPAAAIVLWSLHNWLVYERLHVLVIFSRVQTGARAPVGVSVYESWGRLLALFRAVGAVTAVAVPVFAVVARRFGTWSVLVAATASLGVGWLGARDTGDRLIERDGRGRDEVFPPSLPTHLIVFGSLGTFAVGGLVASSVRREGASPGAATNGPTSGAAETSDELLLLLWVGSVAAFGVFATPFLAVRHLLPGVPPLVWLALRRLADSFGPAPQLIPRLVAGATVAISTAAGFLVAKADYDLADWYRHVAVDVGSQSVAAGRTVNKEVWFTGHWGWAYYAERAGMKPYESGRTEMGEGDFLLMPLVQTWQLPPQELNKHLRGAMPTIKPTPSAAIRTGFEPLDTFADWVMYSVRSISNEVHLYGSGTVNVPWRISRKPLDHFGVVEVTSAPRPGEPAARATPE